MIEKQKCLAKFEKAIQERDKFVSEGLESYPVRMYRYTMIFRHGKFKHYILGRYDKIEDDVNWIKREITEVAKEINSIRKLKAKLLDIEVKLLAEA